MTEYADKFEEYNITVFDNCNTQLADKICKRAGGITEKEYDAEIAASGSYTICNSQRSSYTPTNSQRAYTPPQKSTKSSGCYIATACYGSYDCVQVLTFRNYRDEYLSQTIVGRLFIKAYYALSPPIARWLKNKDSINIFVREKLLDQLHDFLKGKY